MHLKQYIVSAHFRIRMRLDFFLCSIFHFSMAVVEAAAVATNSNNTTAILGLVILVSLIIE